MYKMRLLKEPRVSTSANHGQYVSDITTHSINVRRPHHRWGPVDNVFLCHVDLRTTSRYERWPIKAFLYHSSIGPVL